MSVNITKLLADHLPAAVAEKRGEIARGQDALQRARADLHQLEDIALAASIPIPAPSLTPPTFPDA